MTDTQIAYIAAEARTMPEFVEAWAAGTLRLPRTTERIEQVVRAMERGDQADVEAMVKMLYATTAGYNPPHLQASVLRELGNGPRSTGQIARILGCRQTADVSQAMTALRSKGFVRKHHSSRWAWALNLDWQQARQERVAPGRAMKGRAE